ncbi:polyamine aminopropyltransferase [Carboxydothermus pertinax]|uniref:Polyamine aminopropyltransferase n=1 Tax=Carboxydothermus pertinax TaxID=870242 RepID=A0A1L8CUB8_9THEO|nr:polyamine aminopropyltransferase [Carboxydothermus pertinax]GAV22501.1 spermidine synthase [Carboxydothermus pertinax]
MKMWFYEKHNENYQVAWRVSDILYQKKTPYQNLTVVEFAELGRALVLDEAVQTTEKEEYVYHEMLVHPAAFTHKAPRKALIIGGGDGGTLREVLKHETIEKVDLVEIDEEVIKAAREYLPFLSQSFNDPRVNIIIDDGIRFVKNVKNTYDLIFVDASDPVGPAVVLYSEEFYRSLFDALKEDGVVSVQSESPNFYPEIFTKIVTTLKDIFPVVNIALAPVPAYISGFFAFTVASKCYNPKEVIPKINFATKYYNEDIHQACFALPNFVKEMLKSANL